jgi:hypothetical protein
MEDDVSRGRARLLDAAARLRPVAREVVSDPVNERSMTESNP